jgi:zinc/manganese transport system permease protein
MTSVLGFLALPLTACVAFVLIHAYFGVHVLRRRIVFADLALAQLSALGATLAFANGHAPASVAGFAYALAFTMVGAALLSLARPLAKSMSQEAFVGILYVVASAATVLVIDRSPQGAEHVKQMLIGSILMVDGGDVARLAVLYAIIGVLHWLARDRMLALSNAATVSPQASPSVLAWDFLFYASFGVVVTSSVMTAGVLVVFSFLIVPAVIGTLFGRTLAIILAIAWVAGMVASAAGVALAYALDLPTGAAIVTALGGALALAGMVKALCTGANRRSHQRLSLRVGSACALVLVLASGAWLVVNPSADQPIVRLVEDAMGGPARFLDAADQETFAAAQRDTLRFTREVERLNGMEREARHGATPLTDEDVRRIGSYQQSFNEMVRGEQFVQGVLRTKARRRERWVLGVPAMVVSLAGLFWLARSAGRARRHASEDGVATPSDVRYAKPLT